MWSEGIRQLELVIQFPARTSAKKSTLVEPDSHKLSNEGNAQCV